MCSSDLNRNERRRIEKALRAAIDAVVGAKHPVQRRRHHKIENVVGYLGELKEQVKAALRAAFRLPAKEGMVRIEKQAEWLGARVSQCVGELARRFSGDVHRESFGLVGESFSLPGSRLT